MARCAQNKQIRAVACVSHSTWASGHQATGACPIVPALRWRGMATDRPIIHGAQAVGNEAKAAKHVRAAFLIAAAGALILACVVVYGVIGG